MGSYPKMENNATMHQVFFHLSGKNFKVPGSFSFEDKRTIQEWARIWKRSRLDNSEVPVITNDTRTVSLTSKHQPPLIWTMKHLFDWFHLKTRNRTQGPSVKPSCRWTGHLWPCTKSPC